MNKIYLLIFLTAVFIIQEASGQELSRTAFFGALVSDLDDSTASALGISTAGGTLIKRVVDGSSAAAAKLRVNDVITSLADVKIENTSHFLQLLKGYRGGDKVKVGLYRDTKPETLNMVLQSRPKEKSDQYDIIYTSVVSGNNHLRTIITKPKGKGVYPAVLIVGGVGCYSVENISGSNPESMALWIDSLTRNGFVTYRVEKTGMGDSKGIPCDECDFKTEQQGFLDGLKSLKLLPYVDSKNIFIVGFSMGGIIAPLIAQQVPVKGIIVYGTAGRNWFEYELENTHRQRLLEGYSADSLDVWMRAEYKRLYGLFVDKKNPDQITSEHPETAPVFFKYPMSIIYFQQVADINVRELWMKTKAHVLVMHGSSDFVSSAGEHELIARIVNDAHPQKATYLEIPNSDHWEIYAENEKVSKSRQSKTINPAAVNEALKWLSDKSKL